MQLKEIVQEIENRNSTEDLTKKRYACAHCGGTWTELVGLVVGHKEGTEDLCLRIGMESETCETCRMKARECQRCGSKDVYEIRFAEEVDTGVPLSFKGIRRVSRG
jgi:5-methylcytosine-specific restriction endonuclease McrA